MKRLATVTLVVLGLIVLAPVQPQAAEAEGLTVDIIHNGRTISVSVAAVPWHLLHGDTFAEICDDGTLPPCI